MEYYTLSAFLDFLNDNCWYFSSSWQPVITVLYAVFLSFFFPFPLSLMWDAFASCSVKTEWFQAGCVFWQYSTMRHILCSSAVGGGRAGIYCCSQVCDDIVPLSGDRPDYRIGRYAAMLGNGRHYCLFVRVWKLDLKWLSSMLQSLFIVLLTQKLCWLGHLLSATVG